MRCAYCNDTRGPFHLDHVVPRSRGGPDDPINIVNACQTCNLAKGDQLPSEWIGQVPYHIGRIEQRVSAVVARRTRGSRPAQAALSAPPRIACDACGRDAFPSLAGMHVAWWYRRHPEPSLEATEILAFEVLCTGHDRCLLRKDSEMDARHGLAAHLNDLPIDALFGRWAWLELESLVRQHTWSPSLLTKMVATMRQLSKVVPDVEPPTVRSEDDDPTMVDD